MSWKATAFVKELRANLIVTEKFVLLMLAEYHRTDDKLSWPSIATLSHDCLMEERSIRQILARLEEKRFIRRELGGGRGRITAYQIAGLDYINPASETVNTETVFPETLSETVFPHVVNPASGTSPYKEALVSLDTPVKPSVEKKKACRIPEEFVPNEDHYQLAKSLALNAEMEFQKFRDYFLGVSGSRGLKLDWNATLRNWLRNAAERKGDYAERRGTPEKSRPNTQVARAYNNIAAVASVFGRSDRVPRTERGTEMDHARLTDGSGQAPRPGAAHPPTLDGKAKAVSG